MAVSVPTGLVTHARKVCSLYKRALRNLESHCDTRPQYRYHAVLMRDRFDKNVNIKDLRLAKHYLEKGEEELFELTHFQPKVFANSPGGVAYERDVIPPDWLLDHWHPMEKAMYPKYFALREKRKKEYIEWYNKQYPDAPKHFDH